MLMPASSSRSLCGASVPVSKNDYSVGPHENGWQVKRDGASRASEVFEKKADAVERGKELAKEAQGELRIKGADGKIQNANTYGPRDPNPPKDRKH